uniref:Uncharacterized protein n=1 Tax=Sphaerodactylus townsendi TaxID=933632 RepID=A0ACB8EDZ1_9SAUR
MLILFLILVAQVFLEAVLISACNSFLLGNMSRVKDKWMMTQRSGRQTELSGTKQERLHLSQQTREKHCAKSQDGCCTKCPRGKYLKDCTCETCGDETFLEFESSQGSCLPCLECIFDAHQVVEKKCTPEQNRVCGCQRGYYRINDNDADPTDFNCQLCTDSCVTLNRQIQTNCSEYSDTVCGNCLPGFSLQGNECQNRQGRSREGQNCSKTSHITWKFCALSFPSCGLLPWQTIEVLTVPYDMFDLLPYRMTSDGPENIGIHTRVNSTCIDALLAIAGTSTSPKHKSEEPMEFASSSDPSQVPAGLLQADPSPHRLLLQGRKMYSIIDTVPVRRWKELMRGLGLRDGEIEAVEVEHTQLREQQYEMLKRWWQQQGATMDAIFAVLEDMHLGGCAQELREQLQPSNMLPGL